MNKVLTKLNKAKLLVVTALVVAGISQIVFQGTTFASTISTDTCKGIELATGSATANGNSCEDSNDDEFGKIVRQVINILSILVGAISVIMLIIGGFRYIVSGGESSSTKAAKDTIMYALIGLVIVLFAQVIVRFVWTQTSDTTSGGGGTPYILNKLVD